MTALRLLLALLALLALLSQAAVAGEAPIVLSASASAAETLAAREVLRYVWLRCGRLLEIQRAEVPPDGQAIIVARKDRALAMGLGADLGPEQYRLAHPRPGQLAIIGGDDAGTLYGAYRSAERLGVRFYLHGDVVPDRRCALELDGEVETGRPLFAVRGIQPFHDFSEGPDWWNRDDWLTVIGQLAKMRMNFLGLHCYPEAGAGPEPLVWIGPESELDAAGQPTASYPAHWENTRRDRRFWGYSAMATGDFCAGAAQLFPGDDYGAAVQDGLWWRPETPEQCNQLFARAGALFRDAFRHARALGVKTCIGTETPLCIPKAVAARLRARGLDPASPETVTQVYRGMFSRIAKVCPVDYYWLWTPENWTWSGNKPEQYQATLTDLRSALAALDAVGRPFTLATCGWVLGPAQDRTALDRELPKTMPMSCINREVGHAPVEEGFAQVTGRPTWAIPWMENDPELTAPQPWVGRMRYDAADARRLGCTGLLGIHWRTKAMAMNVSALATAAWDQSWLPQGFAAARLPAARAPGVVGGSCARFVSAVADASAEEQAVYQTVRYGMQAYVLELPDGDYTVTLKFNEPHYAAAGKRIFSVKLQGRQVVEDMDLFARVGKDRALDLAFPAIHVADRRLAIDFVPQVEFPCIAGIVVQGAQGGLRRRINCGGGRVGDWEADDAPSAAVAGRQRTMPMADFYHDFAAASFGAEVAEEAGRILAAIDGDRFPKCAFWGTGPGDIRIEKLTPEEVARRYAFVAELEALRARVTGKGDLVRFDYWLDTYRYARAACEAGRLRGVLDGRMKALKDEPDPQRKHAAAAQAVEVRSELARAWERLLTLAIEVADTPGELGTIDNLERHTRRTDAFVTGHDAELQAVAGPLPTSCQLSAEYAGRPRLIVPSLRTQVAAGEALELTVLIPAPAGATARGTLSWRPLGAGPYATQPLVHVARGVYRAALPPAPAGVAAIAYHIQAEVAGVSLSFPATAPDLDHTLVVIP